jgi:hypothetical protein
MPTVQSLINGMVSIFGNTSNLNLMPSELAASARAENPFALYQFLRALHANSDVYDEVARMAVDLGIGTGAAKGLRNPTAAACKFYRATIWPGMLPFALPIETPERTQARAARRTTVSRSGAPVTVEQSDRLEAQIHRGWRWSNWNSRKQVFAGNLPKLGDQFLKIATNGTDERDPDRVYFQMVEPEYVTVLDSDERGYITYIRVDIPRTRRNANGREETYYYTEVWDKESGRYRVWEHREFSAPYDDLAALGTPVADEDMMSVGVDYVPFVQCQHLDEGGDRGVAAVMPALDKIVYGDLLVTALHQRLTNHNKPDLALVGVGMDADGLPLPPPAVSGDDGDTVTLGGTKLWRLPSGWDLKHVIAGLDYASHLDVVEKHYQALQRTDLPELAWYQVADSSELSGRAISYQLTAAKANAEEVRGNAEQALARADMMLLSIAQYFKLSGFESSSIGTYDNGDFDHWFSQRDVLPMTLEEDVETAGKRAEQVTALTSAGAGLSAAARAAGYDDDVADDLEQVAVIEGLEQ